MSTGDPAGIGPEVVAGSWRARHEAGLPPFFAVGDADALAATGCPIMIIDGPSDVAEVFDSALPVLGVQKEDLNLPGEPTIVSARSALVALELACGLAKSGAAAALVTGPVSKAGLYEVGFNHPGQTEYVAELCGIARENAVMMLAGPTLRTVPITIHIPIAEVATVLSIDLIVARARVTWRALIRDFGIAEPRIAIAGLNPHAGEGGAIGREEIEIITPAVELLRLEGIDIVGPLSADTMFHAPARARYDVALCCFHDQALIPIKTLHFDEGVNLTLGLPIVRTSPDHGTAFEIAGHGVARPGAMIAAIRLAAECAARRLAAPR